MERQKTFARGKGLCNTHFRKYFAILTKIHKEKKYLYETPVIMIRAL